MKSRFVIALLLLFCLNIQANSNDKYGNVLERFDRSLNLSNNVIHTIAQDSIGFLWIGTSYGLNKYDGNELTQYLFNPTDDSSIGDNYIQEIYLDSDGVLWILVPQYLCKYNGESDTFVRYAYAPKKINTHSNSLGKIVDDGKGKLWICTPEMGFFSFDKRTGKIVKLNYNITDIFNIQIDKNRKILWICGLGKIYEYMIDKGQMLNYDLPYSESVLAIDFKCNKIITSNHSLSFKYLENGKIILGQTNILFDTKIPGLHCSLNTKNYLWIGSRHNGLMLYDKKNRILKNLVYNKYDPESISNNDILALFNDREGNVWIGTSDGLNRFVGIGKPFQNFMIEDGLQSNTVNSILIDNKGALWIGGYDGVSRKDKGQKRFISYSSVMCDGKKYNISNVRDMVKDNRGNIWLGKKERIFVYTADREFKTFTLPFKNEGSFELLSMFVGNDTSLWIGTYGNGLYRVNLSDFSLQSHLETSNSNLSSNYIKDIMRLSDGRICLGTLRTGVDIYDSFTGRVKNIRFSSLTHNYVSDFINSLFQDSRGNIWVLSWYGAFVLNKDFKIVKKYFVSDGIASNELTSIAEDVNGDIWLGSNNGLSHIYLKGSEHICNYSKEDGLPSNNISTGCITVSDGSHFYIGTANGLSYFDLFDLPVHSKIMSPIITGLKIFNKDVRPGEKVNGQVVLPRQLYYMNEINLNYRQRTVQIEFSVPEFNDQKVTYAYKLDGIDRGWIYSGKVNYAAYSNLNYRSYTFRVKARNGAGIWSAEKILKIVVHPPFWQTWWAYTLYIIVLMLIIIAVILFILSKERLKHEIRIRQITYQKENEISMMKLKFFTNVSHDLRTPLALIITPLEHLLKHEEMSDIIRNQIIIVRNNATYLLSLINQILDFRKMEVEDKQLHVAKHDIVKFMQNMVNAFDNYAKQKNIEIGLNSDSESIDIWYDQQLMQKVMFNLIGNALKFTPDAGKVLISIVNFSDSVEVKVADTGIGIDPEHQQKIFEDFYQVHNSTASLLNNHTSGTGIGLSIVKKYVEMHNSKINVDSVLGKGSTFSFSLKKGLSHFDDVQIENNSDDLKIEDVTMVPNVPVKLDTPIDKSKLLNEDADTILLVDDNPDILAMLSTILAGKFKLFRASGAKDGLEIAQRELPDIILSDVMMPEVDGFQLAESIKRNPLTAHIPILFLTAKVSLRDVMKGLEIGATDYITKPFSEDILLAKITNLLADRRRLVMRKTIMQPSEIYSDAKPDDNTPSYSTIYLLEDPLIRNIVSFIEENMGDEELNSDLIERHFGLSKMQLYRKLKAVAGLSVTDVIKSVRITNATRLLADPQLNISEVAYRLGFSDPLYFSKIFKKETGTSPSEFRQQKLTSHK
jgi:signal transduction histidine kinase/ligand-binding sensor domain-containing protein/AraC-like DNA-binding protein/ActR/RegA family two-component response regulator